MKNHGPLLHSAVVVLCMVNTKETTSIPDEEWVEWGSAEHVVDETVGGKELPLGARTGALRVELAVRRLGARSRLPRQESFPKS